MCQPCAGTANTQPDTALHVSMQGQRNSQTHALGGVEVINANSSLGKHISRKLALAPGTNILLNQLKRSPAIKQHSLMPVLTGHQDRQLGAGSWEVCAASACQRANCSQLGVCTDVLSPATLSPQHFCTNMNSPGLWESCFTAFTQPWEGLGEHTKAARGVGLLSGLRRQPQPC